MDRDWEQELVECIRQADRTGASDLIEDYAQLFGHESAITQLLGSALECFGHRWANCLEDTSLAQGYVASKVAEDALARVLHIRQSAPCVAIPTKGPVILGNIEDDYHPLGRKMVNAFLRIAGWEVHDLGVDVAPDALVDKAEALGARVIGASAMMFSTARNVTRLRAEIDRRNLTGLVQLAVGGAVFKLRPELVAEFGGDGTAPTALEASRLFDDLWQRSLLAHPGEWRGRRS